MEYKDYYKTLEVNKNATQGEIRKNYRRLVCIFHPDKNPKENFSDQKFKEIGEAYEVLKDPERRKKYDNLMEKKNTNDRKKSSFASGFQSRPDDYSTHSEDWFWDVSGFSDFFKQFFLDFYDSPFAPSKQKRPQNRKTDLGNNHIHYNDLLG